MIFVNIYNKLTKKQILHPVNSWKDAMELSERLHAPVELRDKQTLKDYCESIADKLRTEHHDVSVHIVKRPSHDMWDQTKEFRQHSDYSSDDVEPLQKSVSDSSEKDKEISDKIMKQLGGDTRRKELGHVKNLGDALISAKAALPASAAEITLPSGPETPNYIKTIRAHVPEAANISDKDIGDLVRQGLTASQVGDTAKFALKQGQGILGIIHGDDFKPTKLDTVLDHYKTHPHNIQSATLKYAIHRIKFAKEYDDPAHAAALDRHFMERGARNINSAVMQRLHARLLHSPGLIPEALENQRSQENFIKQQFPESIKTIDGVPHIALRRQLTVPQHGEDYTLSSYSDGPAVPHFGDNDYKYFVPLSHVWNLYDLHKTGNHKMYSSENEAIVDKWHPRVPATSAEVKYVVPRGLFSVDPAAVSGEKRVEHALLTNSNIDKLDPKSLKESLIKYAMGGGSIGHSLAMKALGHKDLTGDDILDVLRHSSASLANHIRYTDVANNPKFTDDHKRQYINETLKKYSNIANGKSSLLRDISGLRGALIDTPHVFDYGLKNRLAEHAADSLARTKDPEEKEFHKWILKSIANKFSDADEHLRPHGLSAEEVNSWYAKPQYN